MRQRRSDARRQREADTMQHARYECPSATLRRTLNRRSSSMYEASGCSSVTSASSDFSAAWPVTAICSSCKPALLCSDGCGAAAVHSMCGRRDPAVLRSLNQLPHGASAMPRKCELLLVCAACVRACVRACLLVERAHEVATCRMRQTACKIRPSHVWKATLDPCRAVRSAVQPRWVRRSYPMQ